MAEEARSAGLGPPSVGACRRHLRQGLETWFVNTGCPLISSPNRDPKNREILPQKGFDQIRRFLKIRRGCYPQTLLSEYSVRPMRKVGFGNNMTFPCRVGCMPRGVCGLDFLESLLKIPLVT